MSPLAQLALVTLTHALLPLMLVQLQRRRRRRQLQQQPKAVLKT
jgi:Flp pilus assembly protein TadB